LRGGGKFSERRLGTAPIRRGEKGRHNTCRAARGRGVWGEGGEEGRSQKKDITCMPFPLEKTLSASGIEPKKIRENPSLSKGEKKGTKPEKKGNTFPGKEEERGDIYIYLKRGKGEFFGQRG